MATIYKSLKSPLAVQVELTSRCNNLCKYCYNSSRGCSITEPELSLAGHLNIARKLIENDVFEVVLTGGEPLLRRDILYPLANYLSSKGIDVKLNTNLIQITEEDCKKIKENGIVSVLGSLPSSNKEIYNKITQTKNYREAVKGIEILVRNGIPSAINMVVIKTNKEQVYETGRFAYTLGVKAFCGTPAGSCEYLDKNLELNRGEIVNTLDDLLKLKEEFNIKVDIVEPLPRCIFLNPEKYKDFLRRDCAAGKLTVAISCSGEVRPCTHITKSYGDILNDDLLTIWKKMDEWRNGTFTPAKCRDCAEEIICSKGCREAARLHKGDYYQDDPITLEFAPLTKIRKTNKPKRINYDEEFIFNNLAYRDEDDGHLIFSRDSHDFGLVNLKFLEFILRLKSLEPISIKKIASSEEIKDLTRLEEIFLYLKEKRFITPR